MPIEEMLEQAFENNRGEAKLPKLKAAMRTCDRKRFLPELDPEIVYGSHSIQVGPGIVQESPRTARYLLEALNLHKSGYRVLEIGTGTGWITAMMCELGAEVVSYEISEQAHQDALHNLARYKSRVDLRLGNGLKNTDRYDRILYSGVFPVTGSPLLSQAQSMLSSEGVFVGINEHDDYQAQQSRLRIMTGHKSTGKLNRHGPSLARGETYPYMVLPDGLKLDFDRLSCLQDIEDRLV